jgi:drug/metabolite transporter (DMT)-like permease
MSETFSLSSRSLVLVALCAVYLVWGSTYFGLHLALESFAPVVMGGVRFLIAGSVLMVALRMRGVPLPNASEWRAALMVGGLLFGLGNGGIAFAQEWGVSSSVAALVAATTPLFTGVFARLWGDSPSPREWLGLAAGLLGVACMKAGGGLEVHGWAAVLLMASPAAWAFGSLWSRHLPSSHGPMTNAAQMLGGGMALSLMALVRGEPWPSSPTPTALGALIYLIVVGSLVGFLAFGFLLRNTRPAVAMSYAYVNPTVAVLLGVGLAGEPLTTMTVVGAAIILASVVLIIVRRTATVPQGVQPLARGSDT